jgi:hypothetical protein
MRKWFPMRLFAGLSIVAFALSGCGGMGTRYPVEGKVTVDGKPLRDGRLIFVPDKEKGNQLKDGPFGQVKDGSYTLTTQGKPGAPAGWYNVIVQTQYQDAPADAIELPRRYEDPLGSGLSIEVVPSPDPGHYDFTLKTEGAPKSKGSPPPPPRSQRQKKAK